MDQPPFEDLTSEVTYWRQKAEEYRQAMEDAREELEDFQSSSRELELELETQLEQLEKRNRELIVATEKLTSERDEFKSRAESGQNFLNSELIQLQDELSKLKSEKEKMQRYIRELEQTNDDLERSKRAAIVSLEDFESRLNQSIERNAILENELDEKEDLLVTVQRLKDEVRDLHQELAITRRQPVDSAPVEDGDDICLPKQAPSTGSREIPVQTDQDLFCPSSVTASSSTLLTPSVRIAALNMVNDALQKIGQLEFKLSALYRSYGAPPLSAPPNPILASNMASGSPFHLPGTTGKLANGDSTGRHNYNRFRSAQTWSNASVVLDPGPVKPEAREGPLQVAQWIRADA